jgi:hypothetical protein
MDELAAFFARDLCRVEGTLSLMTPEFEEVAPPLEAEAPVGRVESTLSLISPEFDDSQAVERKRRVARAVSSEAEADARLIDTGRNRIDGGALDEPAGGVAAAALADCVDLDACAQPLDPSPGPYRQPRIRKAVTRDGFVPSNQKGNLNTFSLTSCAVCGWRSSPPLLLLTP